MIWLLLRARIVAQLSYRRSFAADLVGQLLFVGLDFVELFAVLSRAPTIGGLRFSQLFVVFALAQVAFALGSLVIGSFDDIGDRVRAGTVDVLLVRPLPVMVQVATEEVALRRIGRLLAALAVVPVALIRAPIAWTPARAGLVMATPVLGAIVFGALYVVSGSISFWVIDGREFGNAFTYGSNYLSQWPVTVLPTALSRLFTFVLPAAFVAYLPALAILGRTDLAPVPAWMCWAAPAAALWTVALAGLVWRLALRRYTGGGG